MHPDLRSLLDEATRFTRTGSLAAATGAIQRALQSGPTVGVTPFARPPAGMPFAGATARTAPAPQPSTSPNFVLASHCAAGLQRDYKLFSPQSPVEGRRPLVVMLHGCTQNPDDFAAGTAINAAAEAQGFYALYPAQSERANPQRCWNWFKHTHQSRGRGEPALIADLARAVAARLPVDADRIYVAGLSAGGAMAAICGAAYPDVFAAVAVHSGLGAGAAADLPSALQVMRCGPGARTGRGPDGGTPTIVFHGGADTVVHPANGDAVFERCFDPAAEVQVERLVRGGRACTRRLARNTDGQVVAEHWRIDGASHAWSGGNPSGSYTDQRGPCASAEMLRFFSAHRRAPDKSGR